MPSAPPTNGQGDRPGSGGSPGRAPPAESADVLAVRGVAVAEVVAAVEVAVDVGLRLVADGFEVEEVELVEDRCVVVDAAGPSLIVGSGGRLGLLLVGLALPLPNDQPSKPPTCTRELVAPRLLYTHEPPLVACQYDQ